MILNTYHLDDIMYDLNKIQLSKNSMLKWLLMIKAMNACTRQRLLTIRQGQVSDKSYLLAN
jgi:hypothetical protein